MDPVCPRCAGGVDTYFKQHKCNIDDSGVKFYTKSEDGDWYICQDCGLVWIPATGRRARSFDLLD